MILALSFVPIKDVFLLSARLKKFLISEESWNVLSLFEWFQDEYLTENETNKSINFWNCYERTVNSIPRTTNSIEGMHRHLNNLIKIKQSTFYVILKEIVLEQEITENKLLQSLYSDNIEIRDVKMITILSEYNIYYGVDFLKKIALTFNWKLN